MAMERAATGRGDACGMGPWCEQGRDCVELGCVGAAAWNSDGGTATDNTAAAATPARGPFLIFLSIFRGESRCDPPLKIHLYARVMSSPAPTNLFVDVGLGMTRS